MKSFFDRESKMCGPMSEIGGKKQYFQNKKLFLKLFFWTPRMQLWQPGRKIVDKKPRRFQSMFGTVKRRLKIFVKKFLLIKFLSTRRLQFWQSRRRFFTQCPTIILKQFIQWIFFSSRFSYGRVEFFDNPAKKLSEKSRELFA